MIVPRYLKTQQIDTHLDQLDDLVDWLGYLTSPEYLIEILVTKQNLSLTEAKSRAPKIISHVSVAISFIHQLLSGPQEVSFLPAYYAILNLAKVYILIGSRHAELSKHRWHGATYSVEGKDSHSLLTEEVTLKKGGALALFYETLTGKLVVKERVIKMGDIYPYLSDVSAEYKLATNHDSDIVALEFKSIPVDNYYDDSYRIEATVLERGESIRKPSNRNIAALYKFKKVKGKNNVFTTPIFISKPDHFSFAVRNYLDCRFLYHNNLQKYTETAIASKNFPMPEEFPIALMFFHMSSIVRYKPEFLERIRYSKYWPILASAKRHSLRKFLVLFWSFVHNEQFIINAA